MAYELHPDERLQDAFRRRPYQGADPATAEFLFLGLDANFERDIAKKLPLYHEVLEYQSDGVAYWRTRGVHHPFLRHASAKDGRPYHRTFGGIGLTPDDAHRISFVELLHVPTVGRSSLAPEDLDAEHLGRLRGWVTGRSVRCVFLSRGVARQLRDFRLFEELEGPENELEEGLPGWALVSGQRLLLHYHFSVFGWQTPKLLKDLNEIKKIVRSTAA